MLHAEGGRAGEGEGEARERRERTMMTRITKNHCRVPSSEAVNTKWMSGWGLRQDRVVTNPP